MISHEQKVAADYSREITYLRTYIPRRLKLQRIQDPILPPGFDPKITEYDHSPLNLEQLANTNADDDWMPIQATRDHSYSVAPTLQKFNVTPSRAKDDWRSKVAQVDPNAGATTKQGQDMSFFRQTPTGHNVQSYVPTSTPTATFSAPTVDFAEKEQTNTPAQPTGQIVKLSDLKGKQPAPPNAPMPPTPAAAPPAPQQQQQNFNPMSSAPSPPPPSTSHTAPPPPRAQPVPPPSQEFNPFEAAPPPPPSNSGGFNPFNAPPPPGRPVAVSNFDAFSAAAPPPPPAEELRAATLPEDSAWNQPYGHEQQYDQHQQYDQQQYNQQYDQHQQYDQQQYDQQQYDQTQYQAQDQAQQEQPAQQEEEVNGYYDDQGNWWYMDYDGQYKMWVPDQQ